MSTYAPFAKPLYVMLKPVGAVLQSWHAIIAIIWRNPNYIETTPSM